MFFSETSESSEEDVPQERSISSDKEIKQCFKWEFQGKIYELSLTIRKDLYEEFKSKERILDYTRWADEYVAKGITGEIREIAYQLFKFRKPFGTYEEVEFVLNFVQNVIKYETEEYEYPKYPLETLSEKKGDCEDFSILGAAILKSMGYEIALLFLPGHAALGVAGVEGLKGYSIEYNGIKYYYCEMTDKGWQYGQIPQDLKGEPIEVYPVPNLICEV